MQGKSLKLLLRINTIKVNFVQCHHFLSVHTCSDGCGRTGTFLTIYSQIERLKTEQVIDVFQWVKSSRIQRAWLVNNQVRGREGREGKGDRGREGGEREGGRGEGERGEGRGEGGKRERERERERQRETERDRERETERERGRERGV